MRASIRSITLRLERETLTNRSVVRKLNPLVNICAVARGGMEINYDKLRDF